MAGSSLKHARDTRAAEQHINAMARDYTRAARIRDVMRPVDHEAARVAVRPLPGVRSSVWIDADNLLVMIDGQKFRNMDMIDQICLSLEPLGDTLGVVVNLQDVAARDGDEAETLSRNCQLRKTSVPSCRRSGRWMPYHRK